MGAELCSISLYQFALSDTFALRDTFTLKDTFTFTFLEFAFALNRSP
jgi:hypothetical protein